MGKFLFALVLVIVFLSLTLFSFGRTNGVSWATRFVTDKKSAEKLKKIDGSVEVGVLCSFLLAYCIVFFISSFRELRDYYIENYENGSYVKVYKDKIYKTIEGKTYFIKGDSTYVTQKEVPFEKAINLTE